MLLAGSYATLACLYIKNKKTTSKMILGPLGQGGEEKGRAGSNLYLSVLAACRENCIKH